MSATEWTKDQPTESGLYWAVYCGREWFTGQRVEPRVELVEVNFGYAGMQLAVISLGSEIREPLSEFIRWMGPLPVPAPPADASPTEYPDHSPTPRVWPKQEREPKRRDPEAEFLGPLLTTGQTK